MVRLFRHYIAGPSIFLGLLEAAILLVLAQILVSTVIAGYLTADGQVDTFSYVCVAGAVVTVAILSSFGLYNRDVISDRRQMLLRLGIGFAVAGLIGYAGIQVTLHTLALEKYPPAYIIVGGILLVIAALFAARLLFLRFVDVRLFRRKVLVIGAGRRAAALTRQLKAAQGLGFDVIGYVGLSDEAPELDRTGVLERGASDDKALLRMVADTDVDELVIAPDNRRGLPVRVLLDCKLRGVKVSESLTFVERELGRIDLEDLNPSWLIFSDGFRVSLVQDVVKRVVDIVVSTLFLFFTLPITLTTALLIRLDSPGPVLFRQERVGRNGAPYTLFKFRSMRQDAEKDRGPLWAAMNDDRVTKIGHFIRKTRIDEIPQVLNVLRGEMSFIGPRPERPFFVESLKEAIPYYDDRHRVKPGITGWAQVNYPYGASIEDARNKLAYDLYYIKNRSLFLDIIILLQTVRVVLWPSGVR